MKRLCVFFVYSHQMRLRLSWVLRRLQFSFAQTPAWMPYEECDLLSLPGLKNTWGRVQVIRLLQAWCDPGTLQASCSGLSGGVAVSVPGWEQCLRFVWKLSDLQKWICSCWQRNPPAA